MSDPGMLGGIFDTPIHPILVNFTAALIPASVFSDWAGKLFRHKSLTASAFWMLLYAAVITPATAFAGWWWYRSTQGAERDHIILHMWLGFSLTAVVAAMVVWRGNYFRRQQAPGWPYLLLAAALMAALVIQGHIGGMMTFGTE